MVMSKERKFEILRFLVIGLGATILDFVTKTLVLQFLPQQMESSLRDLISVILGFTIGVIFNYIFSVLWVFKKVDSKKDSRSAKGGVLFLAFALIGLGINYGIMELGNLITTNNFGIDIFTLKILDVLKSFDFGSPVFWLYILTFSSATFVVLIFNYITRKKFIFKSSNK